MGVAATALDEVAAAVTVLLAADGGRVLVGIAGAPGAGKSTLAEGLARRFAHLDAVAVAMDGFHLANEELARLGLADVKGAPETFDAAGFVHLLGRLRVADELVYAPTFRRDLDVSIGSALPVPPGVRLVVVEGNYLLLDSPPWSQCRPLFDLAVYLELADDVRVPRLLRRQREIGRDEAAARDWVMRSDEANARLIASTRARADLVVTSTAIR